MIISMRRGAPREEIDHVCERIRQFGYEVHSIKGEERVVIGAVGHGDLTRAIEQLEATPGVERVVPISQPFKLVSREFQREKTTIPINGLEIGGSDFTLMAGPCSVESEEQLLSTARAVRQAGARILRGGAFKPRTSPYDFQGMEREGLELLRKAKQVTGLAIITEVMTDSDVDLVAEYADILQVGARNVQNFALLKALGQTQKPVMLKRGLSSTLKELLLSAEYIVSKGNAKVILCERGVRTFETYTRNTLDLSAVPALQELSHLPVIVDPSHGTGKRSLIAPMARAAVACGADGLMIEVHPSPENAFSDGPQSLTCGMFQHMMAGLEPYLDLWRTERAQQRKPAGVPG
jgi:3-deoxy-7-phosphoheptulonate synthase